jgi:Skp family chaperone for outer membrane proteins
VRQLQKLVARTDCGLGALERDLAALEATAQSSRQALDAKSAELAAAETRATDLQRALQQVGKASVRFHLESISNW